MGIATLPNHARLSKPGKAQLCWHGHSHAPLPLQLSSVIRVSLTFSYQFVSAFDAQFAGHACSLCQDLALVVP